MSTGEEGPAPGAGEGAGAQPSGDRWASGSSGRQVSWATLTHHMEGPAVSSWGFSSGSAVKNPSAMQETQICGFDPWVRKIPWRKKWQPFPVFLPEETHGQRSLVGYSLWGHKESHEHCSTYTCPGLAYRHGNPIQPSAPALPPETHSRQIKE